MWLVWSSSRDCFADVPDHIVDVLFSSGSERAILSWSTNCSVRRPNASELEGTPFDDPTCVLLLSSTMQASSSLSSASANENNARMSDVASGSGSRASITGASDVSSKYALRLLMCFPTSKESLRWQATLHEAVDALRDDAYSRLEAFMELQCSRGKNLVYKELVAAGERELGSIFMALHRSCFLKLYQDMR